MIEEIYDLKAEYEHLKEAIAYEESYNDKLFQEGDILKTDYINYALNFGIIYDYPSDKLFSEEYVLSYISNGQIDSLIQQMKEINTVLHNKVQGMREKNQSLSHFLLNTGRWQPFID